MAQINPELERRYGFMIGSIPAEIRKSIDSAELTDRLLMVDELIRKADAATTVADRKRFSEQAQRVLVARPRAVTEQIVVAKMAKAKALGNSPQAATLARQAREELALNPPAVRRQGSKRAPVAKADPPSGLIAVFDEAGNPIYVIDPDSPDVIPLSNPDPAAFGDAAVTKALQLVRQAARSAAVAKAKGGNRRVTVYDEAGKALTVDPAKIVRQAPRPRTGR